MNLRLKSDVLNIFLANFKMQIAVESGKYIYFPPSLSYFVIQLVLVSHHVLLYIGFFPLFLTFCFVVSFRCIVSLYRFVVSFRCIISLYCFVILLSCTFCFTVSSPVCCILTPKLEFCYRECISIAERPILIAWLPSADSIVCIYSYIIIVARKVCNVVCKWFRSHVTDYSRTFKWQRVC